MGEWTVTFDVCDNMGWQYANDVFREWHATQAPFRGLRRRRFVRVRRHVGHVTDDTFGMGEFEIIPDNSFRSSFFGGLKKVTSLATDVVALPFKLMATGVASTINLVASNTSGSDDAFDFENFSVESPGRAAPPFDNVMYIKYCSNIIEIPPLPSLDLQGTITFINLPNLINIPNPVKVLEPCT